jgi:hypothetical protein
MKHNLFSFSALFSTIMIFFLGACFSPLHEGSGEVDPVRTGVLVSISGAETAAPSQSLSPRTLLPETGALTYTLVFTLAGESGTSVTKTTAGISLAVELGPGTWSLVVSACNTGTTDLVAEGFAEDIVVAENTVTPVTVFPLILPPVFSKLLVLTYKPPPWETDPAAYVRVSVDSEYVSAVFPVIPPPEIKTTLVSSA